MATSAGASCRSSPGPCLATPEQVNTWIAQAEADLRASRVTGEGLCECHGRYWIQQSYEKAIKAYALMRWKGGPGEDAQFTRLFLLHYAHKISCLTGPRFGIVMID